MSHGFFSHSFVGNSLSCHGREFHSLLNCLNQNVNVRQNVCLFENISFSRSVFFRWKSDRFAFWWGGGSEGLLSLWQFQLVPTGCKAVSHEENTSRMCLFDGHVVLSVHSAVDDDALLLSVSLDHGRGRRQRGRPHPGCPPSLLWSHQVGCAGVRLSVHQNVPQQDLPRVPGQEKTHEERQELARGQSNTFVTAETAVSGLEEGNPFAISPSLSVSSCDPAYYFWTQGSEACAAGQPGGCIALVNSAWRP